MHRGGTKIRKAFVVMALIFLVVGIVLAFSIQESYTEENTLDKWDPLTPSTLDPQNVTGWAYMALTPDGSFLKLNVSASDTVRLRIGTPTINEVTGEEVWGNPIFNQVGTRFTQKVAIVGTGSDMLEIKNEGTTPVNISGNVEKIGNIYQTVYPYLSLGTLVVLVGLISLIYGILTKPKKTHSKSKARKTRNTFNQLIKNYNRSRPLLNRQEPPFTGSLRVPKFNSQIGIITNLLILFSFGFGFGKQII